MLIDIIILIYYYIPGKVEQQKLSQNWMITTFFDINFKLQLPRNNISKALIPRWDQKDNHLYLFVILISSTFLHTSFLLKEWEEEEINFNTNVHLLNWTKWEKIRLNIKQIKLFIIYGRRELIHFSVHHVEIKIVIFYKKG